MHRATGHRQFRVEAIAVPPGRRIQQIRFPSSLRRGQSNSVYASTAARHSDGRTREFVAFTSQQMIDPDWHFNSTEYDLKSIHESYQYYVESFSELCLHEAALPLQDSSLAVAFTTGLL
jgi:hypothetical protein